MKKILALDPAARGIVSSGYCHDPIMGEYMRYGFSGVIAKPYTPEKLFTVMEKVIGKMGVKPVSC
jgi:DNA-binding NarL/FixJ family response regulator